MITCDRCKTENLDGSQYFDECGAPLRPNGQHGLGQKLHNNGDGQNGSHTLLRVSGRSLLPDMCLLA